MIYCEHHKGWFRNEIVCAMDHNGNIICPVCSKSIGKQLRRDRAIQTVYPPIPYDPDDPSPCENCQALREWSAKQLRKNNIKEGLHGEKIDCGNGCVDGLNSCGCGSS